MIYETLLKKKLSKAERFVSKQRVAHFRGLERNSEIFEKEVLRGQSWLTLRLLNKSMLVSVPKLLLSLNICVLPCWKDDGTCKVRYTVVKCAKSSLGASSIDHYSVKS